MLCGMQAWEEKNSLLCLRKIVDAKPSRTQVLCTSSKGQNTSERRAKGEEEDPTETERSTCLSQESAPAGPGLILRLS